ncbi:MAG: PD40 domain-containing protein [Roseiflexaceae bacterium]|nr:PD40 domain-containing protein [Roseiflexaceae bacterium]
MQPDTLLNSRYRIIYTVDERPNGLLLRARDESSGALALLGLLNSDNQGELARQAEQIAAIHHELLLPLTDHFAVGDQYVLVCRDPGGQDLERALRSRGGALAEQETLTQSTKLLQLFDLLHDQRPAIHIGDLWPSDILLTDAGWRITPFSLARSVSSGPTPYRAPELATASVEPSSQTDIYTVSALLYQALTGYPPATAEQQLAGMPLAAPRALNPLLSALAEHALLRGLQSRTANRYQNPRELRLALETIQLTEGQSLGLEPDIRNQFADPAPVPQPALRDVLLDGAPTLQIATPAQYVIEADPATPPRRTAMSTGCLIGLAIGLALLVVGIAITLVFVLASNGTFTRLFRGPTALAALAPAQLGPRAITATNVAAIKRTSEITGELLGPISYAPDGSQIALGLNNTITLNDRELREQRRLAGHPGNVVAVSFSPDGSMLASAARGDNAARIWDAKTGELRQTLSGHSDWLRSVVFSPDGTLLATGSTDKTIKLWDAQSGALLRTFAGHTGFVGNLAFSPDGISLASSSHDGTVRVWELPAGTLRAGFSYTSQLNPNTNTPYSSTGLMFSPDGKRLAVGSFDGSIALLGASDGKVERRLTGHSDSIVLHGLAFSPDGMTLYSGSADGTVRAWSVASGGELGRYAGHNFTVIGIALSPDGTQLASVSSEEGNLTIWNAATREAVQVLRSGQGLITSLSYSPDGQALSITGYTGALKLKRADGRQPAISPPGSSILTALLQNGAIVAVSDADEVRLLRTSAAAAGIALPGLAGRPSALASSRSGGMVAVGSDQGMVSVWDASGQPRQTLLSELPLVTRLAISDDERLIALGGPSAAPQIEVWDIAAGKLLQTLRGPRAGLTGLGFRPGSDRLVATDVAGRLFVWTAPTGDLFQALTADKQSARYTALAFSPDGSLMLLGTFSGMLIAWNADDISEIARVDVAVAPVVALAISPNGEQIAASVRNEAASVFTFELAK